MSTRSGVVLSAVFLVLTVLRVQPALGEEVMIAFASVEEGKRILTSRDDFVERMSPFDRSARLKTNKDVSVQEYLDFVGKNVLPWDDTEKQKITSVFQGIQRELDALSLPFPKTVLFVKTTGGEEGGAAYTRANAIIFPQAELNATTLQIQKIICHELFHIISRANPDLLEKFYQAISFAKCNEAVFPPELEPRKITNPDAPRNDHCIRVEVKGKECRVIPIIFASSGKYDVARGGEFFSYLEFRLLLVEEQPGLDTGRPLHDRQNAKLLAIEQVSGFFEQVGRNTGYIIHPEEILADNFTLLVLGQRNLPSPEVIMKLKKVIRSEQTADPSAPGGAAKLLQ